MLGLTTDGAKSNHLVASLLNPNASKLSELTYKVPNPYTDEDRPLYIFSDPPHLIKQFVIVCQTKDDSFVCFFFLTLCVFF